MTMWGNHGTKVIGAVGTVVGLLGAMSPDQITAILGPNGPSYVAAGLGLLTILRGFQNTKVNGAPPKE